MNAVTIYMEGGGNHKKYKNSTTRIRLGMEEFLGKIKNKAQMNKMKWQLTACGGRGDAYNAFRRARARARNGEIIILLVDSEEPVTASTPVDHLQTSDHWNLADVPEESVHLMVQTMETWIIADKEALQDWYGQNFAADALPCEHDLETVSKAEVTRALREATQHTKKRKYHKIHDATELLKRIDPETVQGRCRHCKRLFSELGRAVAGV